MPVAGSADGQKRRHRQRALQTGPDSDADARKQRERNSLESANSVIAPVLQLFLDPILRFPFILMCPRIWLSMCLKMTTDPSFSHLE